jgi:hypothetical protein
MRLRIEGHGGVVRGVRVWRACVYVCVRVRCVRVRACGDMVAVAR